MTEINTFSKHPRILQRGSAALIVIDMQPPLVRSIEDSEELLRNISILGEGCRILEVPIIGTTQYVDRLGEIVPEIRHFLPSSPPHDKLSFDCCGSKSFLDALEATKASQIMLCGLESHICVSQTAHGLLARGYQVHVITDAVASRKEENCRIGLAKMHHSGAISSSAEMALYELMGDANNRFFKQILNLVK